MEHAWALEPGPETGPETGLRLVSDWPQMTSDISLYLSISQYISVNRFILPFDWVLVGYSLNLVLDLVLDLVLVLYPV